MALTCNKQMNVTILTSIFNTFVLGYCTAAAPEPAKDYWCANLRIVTQATLSLQVRVYE